MSATEDELWPALSLALPNLNKADHHDHRENLPLTPLLRPLISFSTALILRSRRQLTTRMKSSLEPAVQPRSESMDQSAGFFDPNNTRASKIREQVAMETLDELLVFLLEQGGSVGILDATNSTIQRRQTLFDHIKEKEPKIGILFIESVCEDKKVRLLVSMQQTLANFIPASRDKHALEAPRTGL